MESIQLAQMLADLSDLNAAEPEAAAALVSANKILQSSSVPPAPERKAPEHRHHQRVASASASVARTASPAARFDKFGRKILSPPPMTRANSAYGSIPGTPRRDSSPEEDLDRANTLMALYEIRAKLKQQDNTSLDKAREKINALVAKQHPVAAEKREAAPDPRQPRFTFPRTT